MLYNRPIMPKDYNEIDGFMYGAGLVPDTFADMRDREYLENRLRNIHNFLEESKRAPPMMINGMLMSDYLRHLKKLKNRPSSPNLLTRARVA
ncbi:hypothetical protein J4463_03470 [Candidatus Pacearchaeota archaeon]|nr:hypothetical protein [Candidatus Pacearchaeota archaeon]